MQWHMYVDNAQSDGSSVMLNSTHATTVRSFAVNTCTIALLNFQSQIAQCAGTNDNVHRLTTLPGFKSNPVKSRVTQKHAAKVNKLKGKPIYCLSTQFIFTVPHCMRQCQSHEEAKLSLNWVNSIRSVCTYIKRLRRARGYYYVTVTFQTDWSSS